MILYIYIFIYLFIYLFKSFDHLFFHATKIVFQKLSCVQLFCDPIYCNLPGFSVHGISQVRILEWVAISFSRVSS